MKKNAGKRFLSMLLCLLMVVSMLPVSALALEVDMSVLQNAVEAVEAEETVAEEPAETEEPVETEESAEMEESVEMEVPVEVEETIGTETETAMPAETGSEEFVQIQEVEEISTPLQASSSTKYYDWKQYDSRWGGEYIHTKTIRAVGCAATSVAMLAVHSGLKTESNFDPGIFVTKMKSVGGFLGNCIVWAKASSVVPGLDYVRKVSLSGTSANKINDIYNYYQQGYYMVVAVKNYAHYVAVRSATKSGVTIMDPGRAVTDLTYYDMSQVKAIFLYKADQSAVAPSYTPKMKVWISGEEYGDKTTSFYTGEKVYLCYEFYDGDSGELMNDVALLDYNVSLMIYSPDGTVAHKNTTNDDDKSWIAIKRYVSGTYTYKVVLSGDRTGEYTGSFKLVGVPEAPEMSTDKDAYTIGDTVSITWKSSSNATSYVYAVLKENDSSQVLVYKECTGAGTVTCTPNESGKYYIYIKAKNGAGLSKSPTVLTFMVHEKPAEPVIGTDKKVYVIGDTVSFTMECEDAVYAENIEVERFEESTGKYVCYTSAEEMECRDLNLILALNKLRLGKTDVATWEVEDAGSYRYRCASTNEVGVVSKYSYCYFTVYDTPIEPPSISTDVSVYLIGDTVTVTRSEEPSRGYKTYIYKLNESTGIYENVSDTTFLLAMNKSSTGTWVVEEVGSYQIRCSVYDSEREEWSEYSTCDFTVADTIIIATLPKNYYVSNADMVGSGLQDTEDDHRVMGEEISEAAASSTAGDANGDGDVDAYDAVCLMIYVSGEDIMINENAADTNGDSAIDILDIIRLLKYLAGEDVELN